MHQRTLTKYLEQVRNSANRSVSAFIIFLFTSWIAAGQTRSFEHYTVREGISQSEIKCIHQDAEGYLWIGTQNGLNKFDGYSFVNYLYDPTDSNSISNSWIFDITCDKDDCLWLGTKEGLNRFDKRTGNFSLIAYKDPEVSVEDNFVYGITSDGNYIYINTPPVLSILNLNDGSCVAYKNNFDHNGAVHDIGFPIIKASDGALWIGSDQGLSRFDMNSKHFRRFIHDSNDPGSISHDYILSLLEDQSGNIIIGTENGLNIYHPAADQISRYYHKPDNLNSLNHNTIHSICQDYTGSIWLGTEGGGLDLMKTGEKGEVAFSHNISGHGLLNSISHDIVYALWEDHSSNLWIGTLAGLDKTDLKQKHIRSYKNSDDPNSVDLLDNVISSVYLDRNDMLWIGTWGKGLNILNRSNNQVFHYSSDATGFMHIPEDHIHVLFEDSKSRVWMGTRDGVCIFNEPTNEFIAAHQFFGSQLFDVFNDIRVYCIIEDRSGRIWIGTGNGIYVLDTQNRDIRSFKAEDQSKLALASNLVYSILEDSEGYFWIATPSGLNKYNPAKQIMELIVNEPGSTNTLIDNFTISLYEDLYGNIWIGTSSGINRFSKSNSDFISYSIQDGLPSNIIYNIIEDNNHNLWFSTGGGLAMINPDRPSEIMTVDELQGYEFNLKAVYKADDGEMFFGGIDGLVSFYPDSLLDNDYIPPVRITSFVSEKSGLRTQLNVYQDEIILSYKDYSFTLEFAALDYTNAAKNRYAYQMKGISDQWEDIGNRNFVHFTNLQPGNYQFSVRGTNNDGVWNKEETLIRIKILPPWWRSKYAYVAYIILTLLIFILILRRRERKLLIETKKLEKKVVERTAEITRQKEKVEESEAQLQALNATKDKFFSILAHDLKNPFSNLHSMSELITENYENLDDEEKFESLNKIHKSSEFIYNLLENLLTWSKTQRGRIDYQPVQFNLSSLVQININLHKIPAENKGVRLTTDMQDDLMAWGDREMTNTVLRNLINNAVKFTDTGGIIEVGIAAKDNYLEVYVKDTGVGMSHENLAKLFQIDVKFKSKGTRGESGTGLGLILCKEFVEKNQGTIKCESELGKGSVFTFTIPDKSL